MNQNSKLEEYAKMPVLQAVLKNVLPSMAAMLLTLVYNLADTFFIGQTHDAVQVAAVSICTPVFLIFMSIGSCFGMGGASCISRAIGGGDPQRAKTIHSFCMWGSVIAGIAGSAALLIFMNPLLTAIGASEGSWEYAKSYLSIVAVCGVFSVLSNCFSCTFRSEGQANRSMTGQLIGNILNIVLDPVFILGFGMGVSGAALATVVGNICGTVYYLYFFLTKKSSLSIHPRDFRVGDGIAAGVLAIGIPASLGSLLMSISQIFMLGMMANYGDMAVAGIGVAAKIMMIVSCLSFGVSYGVQPLLGYHVGAKDWAKYHETMRHGMVIGLAVSTVLTVLCLTFAGPLVRCFLVEEEAVAYGIRFARILLAAMWLLGGYTVLISALQAIGAAKASLIMSLGRQGVIYILSIIILRIVFGADGLAAGEPVTDVLSFLCIVILYLYTVRKLERADAAPAQKE